MIYLNLEKPEQSDLKFKINKFPDGQRSITILETERLNKQSTVVIIKSITSFSSLELILSSVSAIEYYTSNYSLYSPFIMGARSDRNFEKGGDCYFDDVILPILRSCKFDKIVTLDNHCQRLDFSPLDSLWPFTEFYKDGQFSIVFPDKSASLRFFGIDVINDSVYMNKERTELGIIQKPNNESVFNNICQQAKDIVIFNDLLDSGASFVDLCEKIRKNRDTSEIIPARITIFVTHFIGSNERNLKLLKDMNIKILTSNSYPSLYLNDNVTIIDVFKPEIISSFFEE